MAIRVFDPVYKKPRLHCQPLELFRVRGVAGGLDLVPPKFGRLAFADVVGLAVYEIPPKAGPKAEVHLMVFGAGRPRAYVVTEPGKIMFADFPINQDQPTVGQLRDLALLIARGSKNMVVDRGTAGFLQGGPIARFEREPTVLATIFTEILESVLKPEGRSGSA